MSSKLHQLTLNYSPKEDRLLLRIGTTDNTEYRLWITRRFLASIWGALEKALELRPSESKNLQPNVKEALMAMEHQKSIQSSDFSKKYASDNVNVTPSSPKERHLETSKQKERDLTFGKEEAKEQPETGAMLVIGGRIRRLNGGLTQVNLKLENKSGVEFMLNKKLLHALCHMMMKSSNKAGWQLSLSVGDPQVLMPKHLNEIH